MRMSSWRFVLVVATAVSLIGYPKPASATTVDVTVGPNGDLVFSPSSSRFTQVIRCAGLGVRAATAQRQAPRGCRTASGILEFVTRERPSLAPSIVPGRFRTTALRMVDAAPWSAPSRWLMRRQRRLRHPCRHRHPRHATPTSMLGNISTRSFVQTADNVMIGGFIVQGSRTKDESLFAPLALSSLNLGCPTYWLIRHWNCTMARAL